MREPIGGRRRGILSSVCVCVCVCVLTCEYMLEEGAVQDPMAGEDGVIDIHIHLYKWRKDPYKIP